MLQQELLVYAYISLHNRDFVVCIPLHPQATCTGNKLQSWKSCRMQAELITVHCVSLVGRQHYIVTLFCMSKHGAFKMCTSTG